MERARAELKMGASGEPVFGFAKSSTLPFIAHGGLVEQASVATISKAAMQQFGRYAGIEDHCHLRRWDLPFAIIVFPQCLKMGLPGAAFFWMSRRRF